MASTDIKNFVRVDGRLGTAGQPTEAQLRALAAEGYAAVVNLGLLDPKYCLPDEAGLVAAVGMEYRHIPVKFDAPAVEDFRAFVATMDAWQGKTVLAHCAANYRVSTFVALYGELRLGWSRARADELARRLWAPNETWLAFLDRCRAEVLGRVITDRVPRAAAKRAEYDRSDALVTMPLPPAHIIQECADNITTAMAGGEIRPVTVACAELLGVLSAFYSVPPPPVAVLGVRPHKVHEGVCTYQLFGDYTPSTQRIRVWMRTAIRGKVSSPKALINTLLHEFCHHLDCTRLEWPESFHTRGFFWRIDHLYHLALATPPERRRPLRWIKRGGVWAIDWTRSRTAPG